MSDLEEPIDSLGKFVNQVSEYRKLWGVVSRKELWFRGESKDYGETILRPELYRPKAGLALKPVNQLLKIERNLYEEFQRNAVERWNEKTSDEDWEWDSYFLMQHHEGPTRLLDWSDGALMALHFALRNRDDDNHNARVYVLEPYRLIKKLEKLPHEKEAKEAWKAYAAKHPSYDLNEDAWDECYLPTTNARRKRVILPQPPLALEFPVITRRIAAQRSRFIVFGTEPDWLSSEFESSDPAIKVIVIASGSRSRIRQEIRDCGVTESVIYPDLDGLGREMRQLWEDRRSVRK